MGILDAFKTGGLAGIGVEIGTRLGYGSKVAGLPDTQKKSVLESIDNTLKGQSSASVSLLGTWDKIIIAGVVAILGAVAISKAMK